MLELPIDYLDRMKKLLGDEYSEFVASYKKLPYKGIRLNTLKCNIDTLRKSLPFEIKQAPFSELAFYVEEDISFGKLPAHHAGMFYSQEPSASSAVTILAPAKGDKVLDLCAAPGGKSTQIAAYLNGTGLLWSNEIIKSRANILLSNIERIGVRNAVVSSCHPDTLCSKLEGYFDKVLVDAPCSGEGMFRKEDAAIRDWSIKNVEACAARQLSILKSAAYAVKEDGILVYSTCTFSIEENEGVITKFLEERDDFEIVEINENFGREAYGIPALRIFPMDGGEGHFVAKLRRKSANSIKIAEYKDKRTTDEAKLGKELYEDIFTDKLNSRIAKVGDSLIILPKILPELGGLNVIRAGVKLADVKGRRAEPAHAVFMAANIDECKQFLDFRIDADELKAFLKGEEIDSDKFGYTAVSIGGVITGFGKSSNGRLKNKYPKGLRTKA